MTSAQTYRRPACAVVTLPDPDNSWTSSHAEIGGTLEIRCESPNYPTFEVIFEDEIPSDKEKGHVFKGSIHQPVVIPLTKVGEFDYTVRHLPRLEGEVFIVRNKSHVQPCPYCNPGNQGSPGKK
jgi:hypothetical protein